MTDKQDYTGTLNKSKMAAAANLFPQNGDIAMLSTLGCPLAALFFLETRV